MRQSQWPHRHTLVQSTLLLATVIALSGTSVANESVSAATPAQLPKEVQYLKPAVSDTFRLEAGEYKKYTRTYDTEFCHNLLEDFKKQNLEHLEPVLVTNGWSPELEKMLEPCSQSKLEIPIWYSPGGQIGLTRYSLYQAAKNDKIEGLERPVFLKEEAHAHAQARADGYKPHVVGLIRYFAIDLASCRRWHMDIGGIKVYEPNQSIPTYPRTRDPHGIVRFKEFVLVYDLQIDYFNKGPWPLELSTPRHSDYLRRYDWDPVCAYRDSRK